MNTLTLHPDRARHSSPRADLMPPAPAAEEFAEDSNEVTTGQTAPATQSYLVEPEGEGILFAAFCLVSSLLIYCGVILIHFLA